MKRLLYALLAVLPMSLAAADINITNIPAASGLAITDKLLGVTNNNWSALVSVQQIANLATNGLWGANITNGFWGSNLTNGLVGSSVTNGLWGSNLTNGLIGTDQIQQTNGFIRIDSIWNLAATNDARSLFFTNMSNVISGNGGGLTNVPFSIWTNFVLAPNSMTNLNGLAFAPGFGMIATWTFTNIAGVGPVGIRFLVADTNCFITTNGGTFTGTILDNSVTSLAPANNQLVTASWVRNLFAGSGVSYYATANTAIGFTNADVASQVVYAFDTSIPAHSTRVYTAPAASSYVGSVAVTNRLLQLNAGVTVNAYLENSGGTGAKTISVHPEIYYSYDGTNWAGDWTASAQAITAGVTNLYTWVVSNPQYTATNATGFFVQRRFKVDTQSGNPNLTFHLGVGTPSHITLSGASSSSGNAFLAASQTWTGTNNFMGPLMQNGVEVLTNASYYTNGLVGSSVTNGLWGADLTNGLWGADLTNGLWGAHGFTNHIDVLGAALTSGDVMGWNAATGKWTNGPPTAGVAANAIANTNGFGYGLTTVQNLQGTNLSADTFSLFGSPTKFIFEGHSYAQVGGSGNTNIIVYPLVMTNQWKFNNILWQDLAVSSSYQATLWSRYNASIVSNACGAGTNGWLSVDIGINDVIFSNDLVAASWVLSYADYLNGAKTNGFKTIVWTMPKLSAGRLGVTNESNRQLINQWLRTSSVPDLVIDSDMFEDYSITNSDNSVDGLHPNTNANVLLAQALVSALYLTTNEVKGIYAQGKVMSMGGFVGNGAQITAISPTNITGIGQVAATNLPINSIVAQGSGVTVSSNYNAGTATFSVSVNAVTATSPFFSKRCWFYAISSTILGGWGNLPVSAVSGGNVTVMDAAGTLPLRQRMFSGATSGQYSGFADNRLMFLPAKPATMQWCMAITNNPVNSNAKITMGCGEYQGLNNTEDHTNSIRRYIIFDFNATNSANWYFLTSNGSSASRTLCNSNGVSSVADTNFHTFKIVTDGGTSATGYIDGYPVATNTSYLPTVLLYTGLNICNAGGTTNAGMDLVQFYGEQDF